jgi:hypothetical protein
MEGYLKNIPYQIEESSMEKTKKNTSLSKIEIRIYRDEKI